MLKVQTLLYPLQLSFQVIVPWHVSYIHHFTSNLDLCVSESGKNLTKEPGGDYSENGMLSEYGEYLDYGDYQSGILFNKYSANL